MAAKNRRTKQKNRSDSSSDDSAEDESSTLIKIRNTSFVKHEKEKIMRKTQKVLNTICDSDNDSDVKVNKLLNRPISTVVTNKKGGIISSEDSNSELEHSTKIYSATKAKTALTVSSPNLKRKIQSSSESDSEKERTNNKNKRKTVSKQKKTVISKTKINSNSSDDSNASSSKEFQKLKSTKKVKLKNSLNNSYKGRHIFNEYSIAETPTKSDEEFIVVDKKHEISLKHYIIEEFDKIKKIVSDLKETLDYNSEYVVSKKVKVVADSRFLAHKILRLYDSTHETLNKSKHNFMSKYKNWMDTCHKSNKKDNDGSFMKSITKTLSENRFKLSSSDYSSDSEDVPKEKSISKNKCTSVNESPSRLENKISEQDSSDEFEKNKNSKSSKKINKSFNKQKLLVKNHLIQSSKSLSKEKLTETSKESVTEQSLSKESNITKNDKNDHQPEIPSDHDNSENQSISEHENEIENEKQNDAGQGTEKSKEESESFESPDENKEDSVSEEHLELSKSKNKIQENSKTVTLNSPNKLKDTRDNKIVFTDSEESNSSKGNNKPSSEDGKEIQGKTKEKETSEKALVNDVEETLASNLEAEVSESDSDEIFTGYESQNKKSGKNKVPAKEKSDEEHQEKVSKKWNETMANSEDLFDSTVSEIADTPIKSPILSMKKSFRKTTHNLASKRWTLSEVEDNSLQKLSVSLSKYEISENVKKLDQEEEEEKEQAEEKKSEEENEASAKEDSRDDSELEARDNILESNSSLSSGKEFDDFESTKEDDSDFQSNIDNASDSVLQTRNQKPLRSSKESQAKVKRLTKKTKKLPIQTKTRNNLSLDSSSEEDQQPSRLKRGAKRKRQTLSDDSDNSLPSAKFSRRTSTFNVRRNPYFKADKKLRMRCHVVLERLPQSILELYSSALAMSKKYVANKQLNSLINLDGLEIKKKSKKHLDSGATKNENVKSKKKSKKQKKSDKSQIDEENDVESDVSDNVNDNDNEKYVDFSAEHDLTEEAEHDAKEALLNSSSSDDEVGESMEVKIDRSNDTSKNLKIKIIKTKIKQNDTTDTSNIKTENEEESDENTKKNDGDDWKKDSLLTFAISDTKSDEEKEENNKSGEDVEINEESHVKEKVSRKGRKQRKKRRILDSDSDAKIDSSEEEDQEEEKISDDGEFEVDKKKREGNKKKGKKQRQKSSESDTSSSEKKSKSKRKRIKKMASDDSDSDKDSPGKGRKNIRKVLKDKHVADDTKKAAQDEEERLKRIADRQKLFNEMYEYRIAGEVKVDKLVLDFDEETKKELVVVDPELVKRLKPHQAKGIKFMWDACFESLKQIEKSEGSGCIIAHCMGLGKTFQVVTLVHTLLSHEETNVRTVMVVCPLSTVLNWVNEFKMWLKHTKNSDDIEIYELTKHKKNVERKYQLESWQKTGGVLIIGYEMFRNLTSTGRKMRKAMQESVTRSLVDPGADLVVCDEGHLLKNEDSALSKAMKLVKTMRRIVLTGTPLQNNLKEYHCMVQFVKPNLLGTKKEFLNRFVNPITNGQFDDSTPYDVKLMKKRAHVLHKMLEGSVQRFDYSVLTPFLPPKQEYVIFIRLTEVQIKMYQFYLENFARRFSGRNGSLFADFQELQRVWTHPYVLRLNAEKIDKANEKRRLEASDSEGSLKDFIDDDESESEASIISSSHSGSGSDVQFVDSDNEKRPVKMTRAARMNLKEEIEDEIPQVQATTEETAWWSKFVEEEHFEDLRVSTKLMLLFGILTESEQIGDKVLVFSQSLYSLTLIEYFLNLIDQETQNGGEKAEILDNRSGSWSLGLDYFRLDGSTSAENRSAWCKIFNNPKNTRARLFLISTRAGGLGINLTAANRVIIFDASWNPSHDVQSIFRVYRFGQKKPCYIYRFLAAGTMEEKIYNRQVTKLSLACRVVDEQQIERHYSNNDLAELYQFDPYQDKQIVLALPKDRMLAEIFSKYKDYVYNYHEHDSLLENKEDEVLDEEERKQAWLEYEEEKQGKRQMVNVGMNNMMGFNQMFMNINNFPDIENIKLLIQKDYPNLPPEHLDSVARQAMFDMFRYQMDQQAANSSLNPFGINQMQGNMFGNTAVSPMTQQQHTINQQNQLMNLLNQPPQMNYQGVNHMPAYSGRGRPPKHLSNPMYNPMRQNPIQSSMGVSNTQIPMQASMQVPQLQTSDDNEIEVLTENQGTPSNNDIMMINDIASNSNQPEE